MDKKEKLLTNKIFAFVVAAVCCALWGSAFPMIKVGYDRLGISSNDTGSIILFAGIRFFTAGILTLIIFGIATKKPLLPTKQSLPRIAVLSLFQTVLQYLFFYLGLAFTTGQKASVINGSSCVFALLIACLIFRTEKFNARKIIASVLCFSGVVISGINGNNGVDFSFNIGDLFILLSAVSYAFSSAFIKQFSRHHSPYMLSGYQFALGGFVMIIVGVMLGGNVDLGNAIGMAIMLYLAFVSAVAYSLWGLLLKYNPVSRIAVCGAMTQMFGYLLSVLILGQTADNIVANIIALALVMIGIVIMNFDKNTNSIKTVQH